jgi:hypothetical protein
MWSYVDPIYPLSSNNGILISGLQASKPVDIIELSKKTRFIELILWEGIPLHA